MQVTLGLARTTLNNAIIKLVAINEIHQTSTYIMHEKKKMPQYPMSSSVPNNVYRSRLRNIYAHCSSYTYV